MVPRGLNRGSIPIQSASIPIKALFDPYSKWVHFGTTFGALLARSSHFQGVEIRPFERENEGFGVFRVPHFWETPPPEMGPKRGQIRVLRSLLKCFIPY